MEEGIRKKTLVHTPLDTNRGKFLNKPPCSIFAPPDSEHERITLPTTLVVIENEDTLEINESEELKLDVQVVESVDPRSNEDLLMMWLSDVPSLIRWYGLLITSLQSTLKLGHILFGQTWIWNRDVMHVGRGNIYSFIDGHTKYTLTCVLDSRTANLKTLFVDSGILEMLPTRRNRILLN
ncbi:hypothetical protein Acr_08g0004080 [Actinidia rufa]|uniref:Uncharacterized protein n=1 Tax=Actinidia rufa TaxID=165716 RepID=A0A7J0F003_9ERIC|nr:hypothetical protein Acr_08g0004080 [Actinidia rufa]